MRDFEEEYAERIEEEGEILLEGLRNQKSLAELEKEYSKRVKEIRKAYEKSVKKDMLKKEAFQKSEKKEKGKKKEEVFEVEGVKLEKNWLEKKHLKLKRTTYKIKRNLVNFIYKITPKFIIYRYYRNKRAFSDSKKEVKGFFRRRKEKISVFVTKLLNYIKKGVSSIKNNLKKIIGVFKFRKKGKQSTKTNESGTKNAENKNKGE